MLTFLEITNKKCWKGTSYKFLPMQLCVEKAHRNTCQILFTTIWQSLLIVIFSFYCFLEIYVYVPIYIDSVYVLKNI